MNEKLINDLSSECECGDTVNRRWNIYKPDCGWHGVCLVCHRLLATPTGSIFKLVPHKLLPFGAAERVEAELPEFRTAAITLWHSIPLAPLDAPRGHCNTWIATIDGEPVHDIGLPHKRDAQEALYKALPRV